MKNERNCADRVDSCFLQYRLDRTEVVCKETYEWTVLKFISSYLSYRIAYINFLKIFSWECKAK